jgi:hypothetical protein
MGGTSEMCPLRTLLALGATVVAIARPGAKMQALIKYARGEDEAHPSPKPETGSRPAPPAGTLIVPAPLASAATGTTGQAGCDMLDEPCEIGAWLAHLESEPALGGGDKVLVIVIVVTL